MIQHTVRSTFHRMSIAPACVLAALLSTPAHGLMTSQEGNAPLSPANYTDWPGIAAVINDESRVFHVWVNGNEEAFYRGDTVALERTLGAFAATAVGERVVILRPGRGELSKRAKESKFFDWKLGLLGGISRGLLEKEGAELVWDEHPTLTVYTGGEFDLGELRIPEGVTLVEIHELRERYLAAMRSSNTYVRSSSAYLLAQVDPYGVESAAAVAELAKDEEVRDAAERALAVFAERANDPDDVRARHKAEVRHIRQFVFAWRYPWLKMTLRGVLIVAAVLLAITLGAVAARRARRRIAAVGRS